MALLTSLSLEAAQALGSAYGIELLEVRALAAGSVNSNFLLRAVGGEQVFARLYEEQDEVGARREPELNELLAVAGVPVARPLRRVDGAFVSTHVGKPIALFRWIEGESLCQARVTPDACRRVGEVLAKLHAVMPPGDLGAGRFDRAALEARLFRIRQGERAEFRVVSEHIGARLAAYDARRDPTLPRGLIHGDLFRDNVLFEQGEVVALIDFESASLGYLVYDLMVTVLAWCYSDRFVPELVAALLGGYHAVRPLSRREVDALPVEAAIACLRFATTRITDYSWRVAPGMRPLRDYRRFLGRLAAVEAGALDAARAALMLGSPA